MLEMSKYESAKNNKSVKIESPISIFLKFFSILRVSIDFNLLNNKNKKDFKILNPYFHGIS
ncbi:hypothetical protein BAX98_09010 [Elizabethkingia anophelis]|nr:hypothetical protein BAX98_09010 [Elizabethkingia anophelis]